MTSISKIRRRALGVAVALGLCAAAIAGADEAPEWVAKLGGADPAARTEALKLAREKGAAAAPDLLPLLKSESSLVRFWAARLLGESKASEAVAPLLDRLQSETAEYVLRELANALGAIGDPAARDGLRELLKKRPSAAAGALAALGDQASIPEIIRALLVAREPKERVALGIALCRLGVRSGMDPLAQNAGAPGALGREAYETLTALLTETPPPQDPAAPHKVITQWWPSHRETTHLKNEIEQPGPELDAAIQELLKSLWSDEDAKRMDSENVLIKLENLSVPYLIRELVGPNGGRAGQLLSRLGKSSMGPLSAALESPDPALRREAAELLSEMKASDHAPALIEMAKRSTDPEDVEIAFQAAAILSPKDAIPVLREAALAEDRSRHAPAARALGQIGDEEAATVLEELGKRMEGASGSERVAVANALLRCGKISGIPILAEAVRDPDRSVQAEAMDLLQVATGRYFGFASGASEADRAAAIARFGTFWEQTEQGTKGFSLDVQTLKNFDRSQKPNHQIRVQIADSLRDIGSASLEKRERAETVLSQSYRLWALPVLLDSLPRLDGAARDSAAAMLAGFVDRRTIPTLLELLKDGSPLVRRLAAEGLGSLASKLYEEEGSLVLPDLKAAFEKEAQPQARIAMAHSLGAYGDGCGVPTLIGYLKVQRSAEFPKAAWVRDEAFMALRDLAKEATSGKDFGFEANASATARAAAVEAWEKWWAEKGKDFAPTKRFAKPKPTADDAPTGDAAKTGQ